MITVRQNEDKYEIIFPYDKGIIYLVKNVPGRRWNPDKKMWTIPSDRLGFLINQFRGTVYESAVNIISDEEINVDYELDKTSKIPDIDISNVPYYVQKGSKPYQHQLDFMKYALDRQSRGNFSGFLLCDDPGLAKSNEVINLAIYNKKKYKFKHCLILCCINSSKYNWKDEVEKHTRGQYSAYILGTRLRRDGSERCDTGSKEKLDDLISGKQYGKSGKLPYFLIMNIEAVRYKQGRKYPLADRLIDMINDGSINMIAIDEIHKNASPSSLQGKQLLRVKKNTSKNTMWIPITGTPITSKPTDVFLPLKLTDSHSFNSFYGWCQKFCIYGGFGGYEIVGYKNIADLKTMLQGNMVRRRRDDVLDLPPKIHYTEYVENTPYQKKLYSKYAAELIKNRDEILDSLNPMTRFLRLRQVNGSPELVDDSIEVMSKDYIKKNAKLVRLLEIIDDCHSRKEKVVVFSNWVEPLRTLYKYISKKYRVCAFTGTMSLEDREKSKYLFMNDPRYTVLVGTIGAAGTAQTFTSATNLIFYDSPWNPSDKEQAEDRIYRIGTTSSVNIFTLITKDTVDDRVESILRNKSGISSYIVDNQIDLRKNPELFEYLIGG